MKAETAALKRLLKRNINIEWERIGESWEHSLAFWGCFCTSLHGSENIIRIWFYCFLQVGARGRSKCV